MLIDFTSVSSGGHAVGRRLGIKHAGAGECNEAAVLQRQVMTVQQEPCHPMNSTLYLDPKQNKFQYHRGKKMSGSRSRREEGTEAHSSLPAWKTPWTEEPGGLQSMRSQRVGHDWSDLELTHAGAEGRSSHKEPFLKEVTLMSGFRSELGS